MNVRWFVVLISLAFVNRSVVAQEPPVIDKVEANEPAEDPRSAWFDRHAPTLGGMQFWSDEMVHGGWRIQRNLVSGHYRLLNDQNRRQVSGTYEDCSRAFEQVKAADNLPPIAGKVVIVLHGLAATRNVMTEMCRYLEEKGNFTTINVSYASTRGSVADHAATLSKVVEHLGGATEINFVAHSLGNVVLRRYLADHTDKDRGEQPDPRINRIVMLAPPNNGESMAMRFKDLKLMDSVFGASARLLATEGPKFAEQLATPCCEFGIIAGGRSDDRGMNPLIDGDDDLVVGVSETRLAGARDFTIIPVIHRLIPRDPTACEYTLRFLQKGYFVSPEQRQSLAAVEPAKERTLQVGAEQPAPGEERAKPGNNP